MRSWQGLGRESLSEWRTARLTNLLQTDVRSASRKCSKVGGGQICYMSNTFAITEHFRIHSPWQAISWLADQKRMRAQLENNAPGAAQNASGSIGSSRSVLRHIRYPAWCGSFQEPETNACLSRRRIRQVHVAPAWIVRGSFTVAKAGPRLWSRSLLGDHCRAGFIAKAWRRTCVEYSLLCSTPVCSPCFGFACVDDGQATAYSESSLP